MTALRSWRLALPPGGSHGFSANPGWWDIRNTRRDIEDLPAVRWRLLHALPPLPDGARVLDLGAGTGALVDLLANFYPRLACTLIDANAAALDRAREKLAAHAGLPATFLAESIDPEAEGLLAGGGFTLITSSIALHDIVRPAPPDQPAAQQEHRRLHVRLLRRIRDALISGGHLIYADAMQPGFRAVEHLDTLREAGFIEVDVADLRGRFLICGGQRAEGDTG